MDCKRALEESGATERLWSRAELDRFGYFRVAIADEGSEASNQLGVH